MRHFLTPILLIGCSFLVIGCATDAGTKRSGENKFEITDLTEGTGREVNKYDQVTVHYTGWLSDGKKFDSSLDRAQPFVFRVGLGAVIRGWDDGIVGMKVGGKRKLIIPSNLAYGNERKGDIPPNSELTFEIELLQIEGADGKEQASGLKVKIEELQEGTGPVCKDLDIVSVHYTGRLKDGTKFDSSLDKGEPLKFKVGVGKEIKGWDQGILGMKVGGKRRLTVPAELGYGMQGLPAKKIPGNAELVFEIELLRIH